MKFLFLAQRFALRTLMPVSAALAIVGGAFAADQRTEQCEAQARQVKADVLAEIKRRLDTQASFCGTLPFPASTACWAAVQVFAWSQESLAQTAYDSAYRSCMAMKP